MNIKKSVELALIHKDIEKGELAEELGISQPALTQMIKRKTVSQDSIQRLADALGMKPSELIALGE